LIYEMWPGIHMADKVYTFNPPLAIQPNKGLFIANAMDGAYTIGAFQFSKCI
jgi:hypothetical protein